MLLLAHIWNFFCEHPSLQHVVAFPVLLFLSSLFGVLATWTCLFLTVGVYWYRLSREAFDRRQKELIDFIRSQYASPGDAVLSEDYISPRAIVNTLLRNLWFNLRGSQVPIMCQKINAKLAELLVGLRDDGVSQLELQHLDLGELAPVLRGFSTPSHCAVEQTLVANAHVAYHSSADASVIIRVKYKGVGFRIKIADVVVDLHLRVAVAWNQASPANSQVDLTLTSRPQVALHVISGAPFPGISVMAARKIEDAMMESMSPPMSLRLQLGEPQPLAAELPTTPIVGVEVVAGHPGDFPKSPPGAPYQVLTQTISGLQANFALEKEGNSKAIYLAYQRASDHKVFGMHLPITALALFRVPMGDSHAHVPNGWAIATKLIFPYSRRSKSRAGLKKQYTKQIWILCKSEPSAVAITDLLVASDKKQAFSECAPSQYQIVRWVDEFGAMAKSSLKPIRISNRQSFFLCYYAPPAPRHATEETPMARPPLNSEPTFIHDPPMNRARSGSEAQQPSRPRTTTEPAPPRVLLRQALPTSNSHDLSQSQQQQRSRLTRSQAPAPASPVNRTVPQNPLQRQETQMKLSLIHISEPTRPEPI